MGNNATGDSNFASRGIPIDSVTVDGKSKFLYESNNIRQFTNNLDSGLYEEVAVVRGASGLANGGLGETGGTITLTRKQPRAQNTVSIGADLGSWRHYRAHLDATAHSTAAKPCSAAPSSSPTTAATTCPTPRATTTPFTAYWPTMSARKPA